eukprot:scaffold45584_cov39-Attheya_sp.AAC.7
MPMIIHSRPGLQQKGRKEKKNIRVFSSHCPAPPLAIIGAYPQHSSICIADCRECDLVRQAGVSDDLGGHGAGDGFVGFGGGEARGNVARARGGQEAVDAAFAKAPKIDVVYHIAALVGPFHDKNLYTAVNYHGTLHVMEAAKKGQVPRFVNSSSPSTRFTGADMEGLREDEMEIPTTFLALYAGSKAAAEQEVTKAATNTFMTINVAPHQVYGPHDQLFLPNLLETMGNGRLRIFGKGRNKISVCYVDNYCHGLMCGADALVPDFIGMGQFYIITDGPEQYFWDILNDAGMSMGFQDLTTKFHLPTPLLMTIAYICNVVGFLIGKKLKLNPFNVKMLTIHRYFSIENATRDLKYEPLFEFDPSWKRTIEWYKINWLPGYLERETKGCKKSN